MLASNVVATKQLSAAAGEGGRGEGKLLSPAACLAVFVAFAVARIICQLKFQAGCKGNKTALRALWQHAIIGQYSECSRDRDRETEMGRDTCCTCIISGTIESFLWFTFYVVRSEVFQLVSC